MPFHLHRPHTPVGAPVRSSLLREAVRVGLAAAERAGAALDSEAPSARLLALLAFCLAAMPATESHAACTKNLERQCRSTPTIEMHQGAGFSECPPSGAARRDLGTLLHAPPSP